MNDESMVKSVCMDADDIERAVTRMAHQILEANKGAENLALVGIVTRGDLLAKMLVHKIEEIEGVKVPLGKLDISFYRDDFATHMSPEVHSTDIPFSIDGMTIVEDLSAYIERKLFTLNSGHAICAYLGCLRGHHTILDSVSDPVIGPIVYRAM